MSCDEARSVVSAGLERRREDRVRREKALEYQARQLRQTISGNHAMKTMSEIQRKAMEEEEARKRKAERAKAKADMEARDMKAEDACRKYGFAVLLVILLTAVSRMNVFFSLALMIGLAVFPAVYIYRLYNPLEEVIQ
jgi:glutamyl-tRNA reductase